MSNKNSLFTASAIYESCINAILMSTVALIIFGLFHIFLK